MRELFVKSATVSLQNFPYTEISLSYSAGGGETQDITPSTPHEYFRIKCPRCVAIIVILLSAVREEVGTDVR